jgi:ABC-type polysaccharide/polyol phosphate transport system ATPase subunit
MSASIRAEALGVRFVFDRQRRVLTPVLARLRRHQAEAWGLHDVTFAIGGGEGVALLGPSGSGKTSLLRVMAGVLQPDAGQLAVDGRIASLLSVEAGLLGPLTGRENSALLGVLAGLTRSGSRKQLDSVRARSGLRDAFERPVHSYSEGMRARLGYSAVDQMAPDILLLDEVHEALDHEFRDVVERRARDIMRSGGIVIAAGHDHDLLHRLCGRAILLRDGQIVEDGTFQDVRRAYLGDRAAAV